MFPYCKFTEEEILGYFEKITDDDVRSSLTRPRPSFTDFLHFISPAAARQLPLLRQYSEACKLKYFGKTVRLYAPLYISNFCINDCAYCGFRTSSGEHHRKRLTYEETIREAEIIKSYGIDSLLLVTGEDPRAITVEFLEKTVHSLKKMFSYISIEIYPLGPDGYKRLFNAGVHGLTIYQETYNRELYRQLHRNGPKMDYDARLKAMEYGGEAGFYNLGIGALLGLYNWRTEAASIAAHGLWLRKQFWKSRIQFSFPRITPAAGGFTIPAPVSEAELEQLMLAFRLFFHENDLFISTREPHDFRIRIAKICASHISAGSQVMPGGYYDHLTGGKELGQFTVNDNSSVADVCRDLKEEGLEPVFKDWDCCIGVQA